MTCKNCGSEIKASDNFCTMCGTKIEGLESINDQIMEAECKEEKETRFEKFMSKHFYKNLSASDMEKCSLYMSILMILIQLVRIICVNFDVSTSYLFGGELFIVLSDWYFLSKMGVRGPWKIWGLFLYPVYLFFKARKTDKKYIWSIICTIIIIGDFGLLLFSGTDNVGYKEADFGITVDEYIANVEKEGIWIEYSETRTLDDGREVRFYSTYTYSTGEQELWIYTLPNGNICQVAFVSSMYEYGINLIDSTIINLAAELFAATEVSESSYTLASEIRLCIIEGGEEPTRQLDDCAIHYSSKAIEHNEVAWIEAK